MGGCVIGEATPIRCRPDAQRCAPCTGFAIGHESGVSGLTGSLARDPPRRPGASAGLPAAAGPGVTAPALPVSERPRSDRLVLLRAVSRPTRGGQSCWRDHLMSAYPAAVLW